MIPADILFGGAIAVMAGIAAASLGWNILTTMALAAPFLFGGLALLKKLYVWKTFLVFLALMFFGAFYYHLSFNIKIASENIPYGEKSSFSGVVVDEPRTQEKYQSFNIKLESPLRGEVFVLASPRGVYHYGDLLELNGAIEPRKTFAENPIAAFPDIKLLAEYRGSRVKEALLGFKHAILEKFTSALPAQEAALLGGLTLGSRAEFTPEFKSQMSRSGTTHLVALSGYNIAILVLAIAKVFGKFLSRRKTFYITTGIILLFVVMVGAEASVVRAAIMGFLALLAKETGRTFSMRNAIVLTALGMTLFHLTVLVYDIGFQLSFLSLLGIVYLSPALKQVLRFDERKDIPIWKEIAILTASAQLAVVPVIVNTFGSFSLTAIIPNVLILGFVPLTMFLGFLLAAVSFIHAYLGFFIAKLAEVLLAYEIGVIKLFATLSVPIEAPFAGRFLAFLYYSVMILFIYHLADSQRTKQG